MDPWSLFLPVLGFFLLIVTIVIAAGIVAIIARSVLNVIRGK